MNINQPGYFKYGEFEFNYLPVYIGHGIPIKRPIESSRLLYKEYGIKTISKVLYSNLTKEEALKKEYYVTDTIGRQCTVGPLFNKVRGNKTESTIQIRNAKNRSPTHCARISSSLLGKKKSPEHCTKLSVIATGKVKSPESCTKISVSNSGKKRSSEFCTKMKLIATGRVMSPESCLKMSERHLGVPWSEKRRNAHNAKKLKAHNILTI